MRNATLKKVQAYLNKIPNIGNGGCGISALAIYMWLKANGQLCKDTRFVYLYRCEGDYKSNCKIAKRLKKNINIRTLPTAPYHAILFHNGNYIDCTGTNPVELSEADHFQEDIDDMQFVIQSINNIADWNSEFERDPYINKIEKHLNIDLHIENYLPEW